ncbi:MAG TPA: hypothetical protein PKW82_07895 [Spirochaetales bacterium]|nr:hypothetical protein [Spirochaetales bacterium]
MNLRRIAGWFLIGLGLANIANFMAPKPIPTVGAGAFIAGGLLIVAGLAVNGLGPALAERIRLLLRSETAPRKAVPRPIDPLLPVRILKLAEKRSGKLTVSVTAMSLEIGLDQAQAGLEELERRGAASSEIDEETGLMAWRFPEFLPPSGN